MNRSYLGHSVCCTNKQELYQWLAALNHAQVKIYVLLYCSAWGQSNPFPSFFRLVHSLHHLLLFYTFSLFMVAIWNRADHCIFALWLLSFFSSPNLSGRRLDVYHTSTHGVALVRIWNACLKCAARGSLKIQDAKKLPKIAIWAPPHNFVGLYLHN